MLKSRLRRWPITAAANAWLKARQVEREDARVRRYYAAQVRREGIEIADRGEALQQALRQRLGSRPAALNWPRPLGGLHVFLAYPLTNWEVVLPAALSAFGEVSSFEWRRAHGYDQWAADWVQRREEMNRQLLEAFKAAARRRPVDVVVAYVSGHTVAPEVLREMAAAGAVITNFCFDDKLNWRAPLLGGRPMSNLALADAVDLNLTSDPAGTAKYFAHGGIAMFHPEAADPELHRPLELPFEYDVSFVGACYGWRPRLVAGLRRRGIEVKCFGTGWPGGAISDDELKTVYARSRINLGCGGVGYSHRLLCLKGRDFEVPMSGALYLTQDNPELRQVFDVGREIVTYRGIDDCARSIRELLHDTERAAAIRIAARERCLRDHSYFVRWGHVLRTLGALT